MPMIHNRRHVLAGLSAAGASSLLGLRSPLAAEPPPEVTTIRLLHSPTICVAPDLITEALLRAEGFTDIRYIPDMPPDAVARGELDFQLETAAWVVANVDAGAPITALAGVHVGCYELFAHDPIRTITDLKGRRVGIPQEPGSSGHMLLAAIAAQVGLDPRTDIDWITIEGGDFMEAFARGEVDAFLGFPPEPQELRDRKVGRVILNTATDRPWSQYFCCIAFGIASSCGRILSPPSVICGPSSRPPTSAPPSRSWRRGNWSRPASPGATTTRCRRSPRCRTGCGGSTTPRTRCASMRSASTRSA
jgi:NitT/TauT family transport system substrate-binding protein